MSDNIVRNVVENNIVINSSTAQLSELKAQVIQLKAELVDTQKSAEKMSRELDVAYARLADAYRELDSVYDQTGIDKMRDMTKRAFSEVIAYVKSVHLDEDMLLDSDKMKQMFDDVKKGYKTAGEAITYIKAQYRELIEESYKSGGGLFDAQTLQGFMARFDQLEEAINNITARLIDFHENGIKSMNPSSEASNNIIGVFEEIAKATNGLSGAASEAYQPIISLVNAMTQFASVDLSNLNAAAVTFKSLVEIGQGSYGDKSISNIIHLAAELTSFSGGNGAVFRFEITGLNDLNVKRAQLNNLREFLPEIAKINVGKIQKVFDLNPEHINSLKVSKASVDNVIKLAAAAQILKENNIDLSLQGDTSQEINNIINNLNGVEQETREASEGFRVLDENLEHVAYDINKMDDLAGSIRSSLKLDNLSADDIRRVDETLRQFEGTITNVKYKWKDFGEDGRHVTEVIAQGVDQAGNAFSEVVRWKREINADTGEAYWVGQLASGMGNVKLSTEEANLAIEKQSEKLAFIDREASKAHTQVTKYTRELAKAEQVQANAGEYGSMFDDSIETMRNLIKVYEILEDAIRNGGLEQAEVSEAASTLNAKFADQAETIKYLTEMYGNVGKIVDAENAITKTEDKIRDLTDRIREYKQLEKDSQSNNKEYSKIISDLEDLLKVYKQLIECLQEGGVKQADYNVAMKDIGDKVKYLSHVADDYNDTLEKAQTLYSKASDAANKYKYLHSSLNGEVSKAYASLSKNNSELKDLIEQYNNGQISLDTFKDRLASLQSDINANTKSLEDYHGAVGETSEKLKSLTNYIARFFTFQQVIRIIKSMVSTTMELESSFTSLQIVTGATDREMREFSVTAAEVAQNLGKSVTEIAASIETFSRLGYSLPDATELTEWATVLSNVANVSNDAATTGITSIIKGYDLQVSQAEHVSDVLVSVGQRYAVSAGEMMEAFERSGAALAATNTSFDKSAALIAAANAAVQNSSTVGKVLPMHTVMYA